VHFKGRASYLLGFEFPDFILEHRANFRSGNNLIFLACQPLLDMLNRLLSPPPNVYEKLVEVSYDTTFNIGNFYVSIFSFRHYMLRNKETGCVPTIPAAYFIHQRKFQDDHRSFLEHIKRLCPNLGTKPFAFVTDREFKDMASIFPGVGH
jgi:hypothetical protein